MLLAPALHGWSNAAAVLGLLVVVPLVVIGLQQSRRAQIETSQLLQPSLEAEDELADELERASRESLGTWWEETRHETRWFDGFFAFWFKYDGVAADGVELRLTEPQPKSSHYKGLVRAELTPALPHKKKAMFLRASTFLSDVQPFIECAPIDYELNMWVDRHGEHFRAANPRVSLYGVEGWRPYPCLTCTHNVVTTADGYVLLSLRNARTDFFPNSWSVSFEEQIEVGPDQTGAQTDRTVGGAVRRGLAEELGLGADDVARIRMMALGRERTDIPGRSVRSAAVITHVQLAVPLAVLWQRLENPGHVPDLAESRGWMALRFARRTHVLDLLGSQSLKQDRGLSPEALERTPGIEVETLATYAEGITALGGHGWHPTARARLLLWAESAGLPE